MHLTSKPNFAKNSRENLKKACFYIALLRAHAWIKEFEEDLCHKGYKYTVI